MAGPFLEGYNLVLTCQVSGGKSALVSRIEPINSALCRICILKNRRTHAGRPKPSVTWWKDGELLDGVVDTASIGSPSRFTVNHLFIDKITRSLWGTKLECRAQSGPIGKLIVREVPLEIYRECRAFRSLYRTIAYLRSLAERSESIGGESA